MANADSTNRSSQHSGFLTSVRFPEAALSDTHGMIMLYFLTN